MDLLLDLTSFSALSLDRVVQETLAAEPNRQTELSSTIRNFVSCLALRTLS